MTKAINRLNPLSVKSKPAGLHADGGSLYLRVDRGGARRWVFIYRRGPKRTEMGLGSALDVGLASARQMATEARAQLVGGVDPIEARDAARAEPRKVPTFGEEADDYINAQAPSFRNPKHLAQWKMTLGDSYCALLRPKRADMISTEDVLEVLQPIWQEKPETASRIRGRIERVLDASRAKGNRTGENPARWRGHLDKLLAKRKSLSRGHHKALPYVQLPAFVARLRRSSGLGAIALEIVILTAARTNEVIGMRWPELDLEKGIWSVPPERMKKARPHRVALSPRALAILQQLGEARHSDFVFPGQRPKSHISATSLVKALGTAGGADFTIHGMRSSFRDWAGDETSFPDALAEAALAHVAGDQTVQAYRRSDALDRRRELMAAWDKYVGAKPKDNVVPIRKDTSA